jgi:hypothetical protein
VSLKGYVVMLSLKGYVVLLFFLGASAAATVCCQQTPHVAVLEAWQGCSAVWCGWLGTAVYVCTRRALSVQTAHRVLEHLELRQAAASAAGPFL